MESGNLASISNKKSVLAVAISVVLVGGSLLGSSCGYQFPAVYTFGDSNSDTGSVSAIFGLPPPPYGESFFGRPYGRYSDGRLIIDFIADELRLPFLSAYLDAIDSNFRHGANFAQSGSTIQIEPDFTDRLPRPEEFSEALYILDCGQNDLHYGLITSTEEQVKATIPNIISQFAVAIESYNEVAQEFNKQLKGMISQLRAQLLGARLIYVDIYSAKYSLIGEANKYGFVDPFKNCCGHFGYYHVECGETAVVNGTEIYGASCSDPSKHISYDGIHYTEAANYWVAKRILDGSHSDPPVPITKACV